MLFVDGDADAAVTAKIYSAWFKVTGLLSDCLVSWLLWVKVYDAFVHSCMLHGVRRGPTRKMNWHCIRQKRE